MLYRLYSIANFKRPVKTKITSLGKNNQPKVFEINAASFYKWNSRAGLQASIAQLGERQTEDLKVPRSIRGRGIF